MNISKKDWLSYINRLSKLNNDAAAAVKQYVEDGGWSEVDDIVAYAYGVEKYYGEGAAALAAEMFDAVADASGVYAEPAIMAETASYGDVAKTVQGVLKTSQNVNELAGAVSRLVKKAGADTTIQNVNRYNKKYGKKKNTGAQFAWVPNGDTCSFCLMLASNGWQNQTKAGENHAEHIHSNCDCNYAVRFDNYSGVSGYDPEQYKEMFDKTEGDTWEEKVNSMRRQQYEQNKDKINAQKRAAYAERTKKDVSKEKSLSYNTFIGAANTGNSQIVKFDENADYKISFSQYSEEINGLLSDASRRVAEAGSESGYEYAALIDLENAKEVHFDTSELPNSVNSYYPYLENHPSGKFAMVHNHNTEDGISLPDIQDMAMWENLDSISAVSNNGLIRSVHSNGKRTSEYLFIEFENVGRREDGTLDEIKMIPHALKKYADGVYEYDGRSKKNS